MPAPCPNTFLSAKIQIRNLVGNYVQNEQETLIASTVMGAFALTGSAVSADTLEDLHKEEAKIHAAAAKSQEKIIRCLNSLKNYLLSIVKQ